MPAGGIVTVATANVVLDQADAHVHTDVTLAVSDTGIGMTEAVQR